VHVADRNTSDAASGANEHGVLANLPRTRPQRSTPRRTAARDGGRVAPPAARRGGPSSPAPRGKRATRPRPAAGAKTAARRQQAPVQGFEAEGEASGSVQPPGAVELISSVAEVVSELTKAGVSRSERLLKDLVSRLPLS
jgi:hypothetical protein